MPRHSSPRVFISHSSHDEAFVLKLAADLAKSNAAIWLDVRELKVGDSIVQGISEGLKDSDYLIVVLSKASVQSRWVQAELSSALMGQLSKEGTVVLPVLVEDCEIPALLEDRVYADFRVDYATGLSSLVRVFEQETNSAAALTPGILAPANSCVEQLSQLKLAELRRRITSRLNRVEVGAIWYDAFEEPMDDAMGNREKVECVIELLERARRRNTLKDLLEHLCKNRSDLANP